MLKSYRWLVLLILFSGTSQAADTGKLRLGILPYSDHWDNSKDYNEEHNGIFVEWNLREDRGWIGGMHFDNSFGKPTNVYYYDKSYRIKKYFSAGWQLGLAKGYEQVDVLPYAAISLTFHLGIVHQRTLILPFIVNAYQLYMEF